MAKRSMPENRVYETGPGFVCAVACPDCGQKRVRRCACGESLDRGWRYCPWCLRPVRT